MTRDDVARATARDAAAELRRQAERLYAKAQTQRAAGDDTAARHSERTAAEKDSAATWWESRRW